MSTPYFSWVPLYHIFRPLQVFSTALQTLSFIVFSHHSQLINLNQCLLSTLNSHSISYHPFHSLCMTDSSKIAKEKTEEKKGGGVGVKKGRKQLFPTIQSCFRFSLRLQFMHKSLDFKVYLSNSSWTSIILTNQNHYNLQITNTSKLIYKLSIDLNQNCIFAGLLYANVSPLYLINK